jgi:RecA-family ATPase
LVIASEISKLSYNSNGLTPEDLFAQFIGIAEMSASEYEGDDDLQTITAAELVARPPLEHEWVIPDTIPANGITILAGDVASGKTWLGVDAGLSVSAGSPTWGGRAAQVNRPVLYLANDNRQETVRARLQKLCLGHGIDPPENLHIHRGHLDLSDPVGVRKLDRLIRQHSAGLVLLDIWANYIGDADLNEAHDMAPIMQALRLIADRQDTAFLLLHWLNKGSGFKTWIQRFSGSVQIPGGCDISFMLTNDKGIRKLKQEKSRDSALVKPQQFVILDVEGGGVSLAWDEFVGPSGEGVSVAEKAADLAFRILEKQVGQTLTTPELKDELKKAGMDIGRTRFYKALEILAAKPSVQQTGGVGRPYLWSVVKENVEIPF